MELHPPIYDPANFAQEPSIVDKHDKVVQYYNWPNWWSFAEWVQKQDNFDYIFRGQSNCSSVYPSDKFEPWPIKSSFNREYFQSNYFDKRYFVLYDVANCALKYYEFPAIKFKSDEIPLIDIMQFIQHYVGPTPLIDFTKDPLTALYFASVGIPKEAYSRAANRYFTVIQLDYNILKNQLGIVDLSERKLEKPESFEISKDSPFETVHTHFLYNLQASIKNLREDDIFDNRVYNAQFTSAYNKIYSSTVGMSFLVSRPNSFINQNLHLQEGLFIYLDSRKDLEDVFLQYVKRENVTSNLIKYHQIPFISCTRNGANKIDHQNGPLFPYLMRKNKIGLNLFAKDDKEGLRMDLRNGFCVNTLNCANLQDYSKCECMKLLRDKKIYV